MTTTQLTLDLSKTTTRIPLIVNYGAGVDSTAMLIGLHRNGERPDVILFADTGVEKPETYAYLDVMDAKLVSWGWPKITRVAYKPARASYTTLEGNCLVNETLPGAAFGMHNCSLKFKADPMDNYLLGVSRGVNKCPGVQMVLDAIAAGVKPVKCIGYDCGKADTKRFEKVTRRDAKRAEAGEADASEFTFRYPLREWGWDREQSITEIAAEGMPVPVKSACFFCPSSKPWELLMLAAYHPDLFLRSIKIEDTARAGKHGLQTVAGLWRKQSWRGWAEEAGILKGNEIVMPKAELEKLALAAKPAIESACDGKACL